MSTQASTQSSPGAPGSEPIRLLEVELSRPLPPARLVEEESGRRYARAQALVRLHGCPLGFVELTPPAGAGDAGDAISPAGYAHLIWAALGAQILDHLREDGLPAVSGIGAEGLPLDGPAPCALARQAFLREAPFVSVVVATRDRPQSIAACLRSLGALEYPRFEVIVVDNVPTSDETRELVQQAAVAGTECGGPVVRYAREDRPGPSWARNRGLGLARGDVVAFTDDDVLLDPHWLAELVRGFGAGPAVVCVTGPIVPRELETPAQIWLEQYGGFCKGFAQRVYDRRDNRPPDPLFPYTVGRFGSGANMAFRAATLRALGGLDPALGPATPTLAGEDIALFLEVVLRGHQLVYQPGAIVYHAHSRDFQRFRRQIYAYGVGLAACVTKSVLDHPGSLPDFLRRLPGGLAFALDPRSAKNRKKLPGYPAELTRVELRGMLTGPLAYLRSRWRLRQGRRGPPRGPRPGRASGGAPAEVERAQRVTSEGVQQASDPGRGGQRGLLPAPAHGAQR
jgi:GT2 family glycosyltransferase